MGNNNPSKEEKICNDDKTGKLITNKLSKSIGDEENLLLVAFRIFRSKENEITEENEVLRIHPAETIENLKKELNKRFHLGKDLKNLIYDLRSDNQNDKKIENPFDICDKSKVESFGKTPHFIISSQFQLTFSSPFESCIFLKRNLCSELNEIQEHFSKEYDVPKEEILLFYEKSSIKLSKGILLDYLIDNQKKEKSMEFGNKKLQALKNLRIEFYKKIDLKINFNDSDKIYEVSPYFQIKTLKNKFESFFRAKWANQIWKLTFPEERRGEILKDDYRLEKLQLSTISVDVTIITRNEQDFTRNMKEILNKYPPSVEKDILKLYFDLDLEKKMIDKNFDEILEQLKELEKTIMDNSPYSINLGDSFKNIYLILENRDEMALKRQILQMFQKIDPLNLESLIRNLKVSEMEAKKLIFEKKVFLFLGATGVGKSTTICYLNNCKMTHDQYGNVVVEKDSFPSPPCKISGSIYSETRGFHPVVVPLIENKEFDEKYMILCDTAGFNDNEGAALDLLNSLSLTQAVKYASKVKPIIIINESSVGAKFEGVKSLIYSLMKMIPNLYDLKCCDYLFTNFHIFNEKTIQEKLDSLCLEFKNGNFEKKETFLEIVKDIKTKLKILSPLEKQPCINEIFYEWMKRECSFISHPDESFHNNFSLETIESARNQIEQIKLAITFYINSKDYEIVNFKLKQLKKFAKLLPYHFKDVYEQGINETAKALNDNFLSEINVLLKKITENIVPFSKEIQHVFKMEYFEPWDNVRKKHLKNYLINFDFLMDHFKEQIQILSSSIEKQSFNDEKTIIFLKNLKTLADYQSEFNKVFKKNHDIFNTKVEEIISSFQNLLEKNDLQKIVDDLNNIEQTVLKLQFKNEKNELYGKAKEKILEYYDNFENDFEDDDEEEEVLNYKLEKLKFESLIIRLKKLELVEHCKELDGHIPLVKFSETKALVCKKISRFLNKMKDAIIKNENYSEVKSILLDMNEILIFTDDIKQTSLTLFKMVKMTFRELKSFIKKVEQEVIDVLNDLQQKKEKINFTRLNKAIDCLSVNQDLINKIIPGAKFTFLKIDEEINCYFADKKEEFDQIDLNYRNHENLNIVKDLLLDLSKIRKYEKLFEKVKKNLDEILVVFLNSIEVNFFKIKNEGNFEFYEVLGLENMFNYLKNLDDFLKNKMVIAYLPELKVINAEEKMKEFMKGIIQKLNDHQTNFLNFNEEKMNFEGSVQYLSKLAEFSMVKNLSKELKIESLFQQLIKKLNSKHSWLKIELLEANELENFKEVFEKLNICKHFFEFDYFLSKEFHFYDLYLEEEKKFREIIKKLVKKAQDFIQNNEFEGLKQILELLDLGVQPLKPIQLFNIVAKNKEVIRVSLKNHFKLLNQKIEMSLQLNFNRFLEKKDFFSIYSNLQTLKEAHIHLTNQDPNIGTMWENWQENFFKIFSDRMEFIENEIISHKFTLAEQNLNELKSIMHFLRIIGKEKADEILVKVKNFENVRKESLSYFLEETKKMNLEMDIEYAPPKERYEELRKLSCDNHQYQNLFREYSNILTRKLQEKIEATMQNSQDNHTKRSDLLKVKNCLAFMPELIKNYFLEKIEEKLLN